MAPPETTAKDILSLIDTWQAKLPRKAEPQPQQRAIALQPRTETMPLAGRVAAQIADLDEVFVELTRRALECKAPEQVELLSSLAVRCARQSAASLKALAEAGLLQSLAAGAKPE
jgi:hypothetical protein